MLDVGIKGKNIPQDIELVPRCAGKTVNGGNQLLQPRKIQELKRTECAPIVLTDTINKYQIFY